MRSRLTLKWNTRPTDIHTAVVCREIHFFFFFRIKQIIFCWFEFLSIIICCYFDLVEVRWIIDAYIAIHINIQFLNYMACFTEHYLYISLTYNISHLTHSIAIKIFSQMKKVFWLQKKKNNKNFEISRFSNSIDSKMK